MKRYLQHPIKQALSEKIVLATGPRQSGKTTFAKTLYDRCDYFNFDVEEDRIALQQAIQLVKDCKREKTFDNGVEIRALISWLVKFNLLKR